MARMKKAAVGNTTEQLYEIQRVQKITIKQSNKKQ